MSEARRRFDAAYSIRYSSTESGGVGTGTAFDADDDEALHTVSRPRGGIEVAIGDDGDGDDDVGEVRLRSPATMARHWDDPEATAAVLQDRWLRTGDLGRIDERGCLVLSAGRRGAGTALVEQVCSWSAAMGHPAVTLSTFATVAWNAPFYGKLGFRILADDELTPGLRADRVHEAAVGLDTSARVFMCREATPPAG